MPYLTQKYATAGMERCTGETGKQLARRLRAGPGINGMFPNRGPLAKCRELSESAWLYFPHIELVFLFYAFDGTVAAQVSGVSNFDCPEVFYPSIIALVSYPTPSLAESRRSYAGKHATLPSKLPSR